MTKTVCLSLAAHLTLVRGFFFVPWPGWSMSSFILRFGADEAEMGGVGRTAGWMGCSVLIMSGGMGAGRGGRGSGVWPEGMSGASVPCL